MRALRTGKRLRLLLTSGTLLPALIAPGLVFGSASAQVDPAQLSPPGASHVLEEIQFESDGTWFRMRIPSEAPWSHWTLDNPPRIVIDLGQTTSRLPEAPGLFQTRLDRGPVRIFRTSQYLDEPLDRRARVTLELTRSIEYEASREGNVIEVRISDPAPREPRRLWLDGSGLHDNPPPLSLPSSRPSPLSATPSSARNLREALEDLVGRENVLPRAANSSDALPRSDAGSAPGRNSPRDSLRPVLDPTAPVGLSLQAESTPPIATTPVAPDPTATEPEQEPAELHGGAEEAMGLIEDSSTALEGFSDPGGPDALTSSSVEETPEDGAPPSSSPEMVAAEANEARDRSAARLLREAARSFVRGEERSATAKLERARRYYGSTPAGGQVGLFLKELLVLEGRDLEADQLTGLPDAPDTSRIPEAAFLHLMNRLVASGDLLEADRLYESWGPLYGKSAAQDQLAWTLAVSFYRAGRQDRSQAHLDRVAAGDSLEARSLLLLARIFEERGEKEQALQIYRRVSILPASPWQKRSVARSADLEFQAGRLVEALDFYESVLENDPLPEEEVWALYQTANCLLLLGEKGKAKIRYQTVVQQWPQSYWAPFAGERLEAVAWQDQLFQSSAESRP